MALIVAGRLLLGASCIGLIAAGACLLGIDQQVP
jgi:succinyl-CoA synthetase alpha subunit